MKLTKGNAVMFIRTKIAEDDKWAIRALKVIAANQVAGELEDENVKYHNGIGFTPTDAPFLCSLAKQAETRPLSIKQMTYVKKLMVKYAGQIVNKVGLDWTKLAHAMRIEENKQRGI